MYVANKIHNNYIQWSFFKTILAQILNVPHGTFTLQEQFGALTFLMEQVIEVQI